MNYVETYEDISRIHLAHIAIHGLASPWVPDAMYRATQEDTEALALEIMQPGMKVLDVGIGPGFTCEKLHERGAIISGVDVARPYIERLEKLHPTWELLTGNVEAMPFKENSFDFVLCCDVLEHVLDVHRAMRNILEVMKPGAVALFRVPCDEDLRGYVNGTRWEFLHVRGFSEASLVMLITKCHGQECVASGNGQREPSEVYALMRKVPA